jgi:hypothetical protein
VWIKLAGVTMLCTSGLTSPNLDEESIGYRAVPFFEERIFLSEVREHVVSLDNQAFKLQASSFSLRV